MTHHVERDLNRDSMASSCSLAQERGDSLDTAAEKEMKNLGKGRQEQKEMEIYHNKSKQILNDSGTPVLGQEECVSRNPVNGSISTTQQIQDCRLGGGGETAVVVENGNESEARFQVSGLYLLSPEAQLLTQEILLETESVCSQSKTTPSECGTGSLINPPFDRSNDTSPVLKSELRVTFRNDFTETDSPKHLSRHQLSRQTATHQLTEPTCTCKQDLAKHKSWQPRSMEQLPAQAPRQGRKLSDIVGISRHHSTSVPRRPHSAAPGGQTATVCRLPKTELLTRPKSAVERLHKTVADEDYRPDSPSDKSTIFVDLSKLHPLHIDSNDNSNF